MELWPDEYLPDDYSGPSAGPIKSLVGKRRLYMVWIGAFVAAENTGIHQPK
jgi:hypothetical protein